MNLNDIQIKQIQRSLSDISECPDTGDYCSSLNFQGRMFEIIKQDDGRYFLYEMTPTGVLFLGGKSSDSRNWDNSHRDVLPDTYRKDPNGFESFCSENSIDMGSVCRAGGGYGVGTIYHPNLDVAINHVIEAIKHNTVVKHFRTKAEIDAGKTEEQLKQEKIKELQSSLSYWKGNMMPESDSATLFGDKQNMFASSIPEEYKAKILSYLNAPTLRGWEEIRGVLITRTKTIWQMMVKFDSWTPVSGSGFNENNIPTPDMIVIMFSKAVVVHNKECSDRISEIERQLEELKGNGSRSILSIS